MMDRNLKRDQIKLLLEQCSLMVCSIIWHTLPCCLIARDCVPCMIMFVMFCVNFLIVPCEALLVDMMITIHHTARIWTTKRPLFPVENWCRIWGARILLPLNIEIVLHATFTMKMEISSYPTHEPHIAQSTNDTKSDVTDAHDHIRNTISCNQTTQRCVP